MLGTSFDDILRGVGAQALMDAVPHFLNLVMVLGVICMISNRWMETGFGVLVVVGAMFYDPVVALALFGLFMLREHDDGRAHAQDL